MRIEEIAKEFDLNKLVEEREVNEQYGEFVIRTADVSEWCGTLDALFGPAIKPEGVEPKKEHTTLTEEYGGIFTTQTLYKKDFDGYALLAMLWPWGDKIHTTLRIAKIVG